MLTRYRTAIFITLGVGLAVAGIIGLLAVVRPALEASLTPPTPIPPLGEGVVVATRDIPLGSLLSEGDLTVVQMPVQFIPRTALRDRSNAIGRFTKASLVEGQLVLGHQLADPTNRVEDLAFILSADHVLFALHPRDLISELAIVQRGDLIDIFVSRQLTVSPATAEGETTEQAQTSLYTFDALQSVSVTAMVVEIHTTSSSDSSPIQGEQDAEPENEIIVSGYLLALGPQDALVLKHLRDAGAIFDFVVRSPASVTTFELDPVTEEYLIERYRLNVTSD